MDTIQNYKCPCCGAPLVFDTESQNLHCESCENTFPLETVQHMWQPLLLAGCCYIEEVMIYEKNVFV